MRLFQGSCEFVVRLLKNHFLIALIGRFAGFVLQTIFSTLRYELRVANVNPYDHDEDPRCIYVIWHDSAVLASFGGHHKRTVALTSRHRDGTFVESVLRSKNVRAVRGSTGQSGARAAIKLLRVARENDIVITPDGPRGPRRTMSRGAVYLASKSGSLIVPTAFKCSRCWDIKGSWTTLTIPKPFARISLLAGDPIEIPPNLSNEEIERYVDIVQQKMDELEPLADRVLQDASFNPFAETTPSQRMAA